MPDSDALSLLSLFSGCGGLDLGLERAGFRTLFANDISCDCAESYIANLPHVSFHVGSVGGVTRTLLRRVIGREQIGCIDLLAGGPPCPPYSKSRFYRKDKPRALEDPLGWETLGGYLEVLRIVKPRAFLLENVAGLAYKVHRDALDHVLSTASRLGYTVEWKVVNAANHGVPQIRERLFMIGMRGHRFIWPEGTHAKPSADDSHADTEPRKLWLTAGEAMGDLDTPENFDDAGHVAGGKHHDLLKLIPPGDNYLYFTAERGHPQPLFKWRSRYWSFLLKLSPELPSWTIQARRSNNMGPFHWRNRILRIAEVKRLQTFPDAWWLAGETTERHWRQVGNAVPPVLAEALGTALAQQLLVN